MNDRESAYASAMFVQQVTQAASVLGKTFIGRAITESRNFMHTRWAVDTQRNCIKLVIASAFQTHKHRERHNGCISVFESGPATLHRLLRSALLTHPASATGRR